MSTWQEYYEKMKGRPVRELLLRALEFHPVSAGQAIDLGCGDGTETVHLLSKGWKVFAVDRELAAFQALQSMAPSEALSNLDFRQDSIENLGDFPEADLIFACNSLPFCQKDKLDPIWEQIRNSLKPEAIFAGTFFGMRDDWVLAGHCAGVTEEKLNEYFSGFEVLKRKDQDEIGRTALSGPKHWHLIEVILRKKAERK